MGLRFPQQIARIDTLSREPINNRIEAQILEHIHNRIQRANAVLFSDYHTGMLTPSLVTEIRHLGRETGVLLTADTQGNLEKFRQFAVVKCNADDARSYLRRDIKEDDEFAAAARELYAALELSGCMVITRGADGATLCANGMVHHCPSPAVSDVYDTVGAGDTSIAVMTLAVAAGAPYIDAVTLANYASGIVVRHVGNYAPTPDELAAAVRANHPES
jgi:rfaE bifunctional protein kinase chain/domain